MPRTYLLALQGRFAYQDEDGELATMYVAGQYDVSTIPGRGASETVLFKTDGDGPRQIELWYWKGHPDADTVRAELAAGRFTPRP